MDLGFEDQLLAELARVDSEVTEAISRGERHGEFLFAPKEDGHWYLFGPTPWPENHVLAVLPPHPVEARPAIVAAYAEGHRNGEYYGGVRMKDEIGHFFVRSLEDLGKRHMGICPYDADELDEAIDHAEAVGDASATPRAASSTYRRRRERKTRNHEQETVDRIRSPNRRMAWIRARRSLKTAEVAELIGRSVETVRGYSKTKGNVPTELAIGRLKLHNLKQAVAPAQKREGLPPAPPMPFPRRQLVPHAFPLRTPKQDKAEAAMHDLDRKWAQLMPTKR